MLVRLKKRGKLPPHGVTSDARTIVMGISPSNIFRGRVIEVSRECRERCYDCGGDDLCVTDSRYLALFVPEDQHLHICSHFLIDDLDAYESDAADETAEVGDLACAGQVVSQ